MSAAPLTMADRTLLRALAAWGEPEGGRFWDHFEASWRDRLRQARQSQGPDDPEAARGDLRRAHREQVAPDPARVHPTWWVRALKDESPAVQRAAANGAPESIRDVIGKGLRLGPEELQGPFPAHPDALAWARALWTERLVGGLPPHEHDPPAILALTDLDHRSLTRLLGALGLAKWACAAAIPGKAEAKLALNDRQRGRFDHFRDALADLGDAAKLARLDVDAHIEGKPEDVDRLGLVTLARNLAVAEPQRVRWALQHLPYLTAKFIRSRMGLKTPFVAGPELVSFEARVLRAAWDRLRGEGRLDRDWPGGPA